jgi:ABC-type uncharacterized transport system permease subunit
VRVPAWFGAVRPLLTILVALAVASILMKLTGYDPGTVLAALWSGAFGNVYNLAGTLVLFIPLVLMGVGVALGFQGGLFNIGAQGQYWMGAIAAAWAGIHFPTLPPWIHVPLALAVGTVAGGIYAIPPALLKAYRGAHEVITTMMLSYAAADFGHWLLERGPMQMPGIIPQSRPLAASAQLQPLVASTNLSAGIYVALAVVVVGAFLLYRTRFGFELRMLGRNPKATRVAGVSVPVVTVATLALSGLFAGLAGALQVVGVTHQLLDTFNEQYGYTAIVVALLARNNPWATIPAALLFAGLESGGGAMQMFANIPGTLADVIQGLIVLFVATDRMFDWLWARRRRRPPGIDRSATVAQAAEVP